MRILVIADSINQLKPKTDTGLALAYTGASAGHEVYWGSASDHYFAMDGNSASLYVRSWKIEEMERGALPKLSEPKTVSVVDFDTVWIRRDPPFSPEYMTLCHWLSHISTSVLIVNDPKLLVTHHEKSIPMSAFAEGYLKASDLIPTWVVKNENQLSEIPKASSDRWVLKPWFGHSGRDVVMWDEHALVNTVEYPLMVQPYQPTIREKGDRRVFFLDGEYVGGFVRMPAKGSFRSNLSQGGKAVNVPLEEKEKAVIERLGKYLKDIGFLLAGADLIDGKVSEVNVTAPTGFSQMWDLEQVRLGEKFLSLVEEKLRLRNLRQ